MMTAMMVTIRFGREGGEADGDHDQRGCGHAGGAHRGSVQGGGRLHGAGRRLRVQLHADGRGQLHDQDQVLQRHHRRLPFQSRRHRSEPRWKKLNLLSDFDANLWQGQGRLRGAALSYEALQRFIEALCKLMVVSH